MKISKKLVYDYINGEDIENIDDLEDNYRFMMEVIKITHDKNMYHMCSDEVKNNYEFIKFMVLEFSSDLDFIIEVANEYMSMSNNDRDVTRLELTFIMANLLKDYKNLDEDKMDVSIHYNMSKSMFLSSEKVKRQLEIIKEEDLFWKEEFGLGFRINQYEYYCTSDIVMNEIASTYIEDIFYNEADIKLEDLIHNRFKTVDDFNNFGVRKFLLNYIRCYDTNLADYIECHINLLRDLEKDINRIIRNFNNYNDNLEVRRNLIFKHDAYEILGKYNCCTPINEFFVIIDKMNIKGIPKFFINDDEGTTLNLVDINNIEEYKIIKELIELAKEVYLKPITELDDGNVSNKIIQNKADILDFDLSKSKKYKNLRAKKLIPKNNKDE